MNILERIISVVAPNDCVICGKEGSLICDWCELEAFMPVPPRCSLCKTATPNFSVCRKCRPKTKIKRLWVRTEYSPAAKRLVKAFKFERAQSAASSVAQLMAEALPHLEDYLIVPVPTASTRVRLRGYDHTKLIARELSKATKLHYEIALIRLGQSRQVGAKRQRRLKQLEGAFRLKKTVSVRGEKILLVDDIVTTGSTLAEAAKVLKQAGAKEIGAVVFAQTA